MVKVFDVRKSDGQILLLGGSLTLPNTGTVVTGSVPPGSIRYNPSSQNIEVNGGSSWSPVSQTTISNNTVVSNISGITATPSANTLTAIIDSCIGSTQGDILYRNATIWTVLATGTSGQFLTTQGASANPIWSNLTSGQVTTALGGTPLFSNQTITLSGAVSGSGSTSISTTLNSINSVTIGATTPSTGAFTTLSATSTVTLSPASANVVLSPTGTGVVTIAPATLGTMDNMTIGGTTPATAAFSGITFGANVDSSQTSLAKHIQLHTAGYGFGITSNQLNYVVPSSARHIFLVNGAFVASVDLNGLNGALGTTTASTGAFTTLSASSTVSGSGFSTYLASPPAIGGTAAAAGTFTNLTASSSITVPAGSISLGSIATISALTILSNITGGSAAPSANTLTAIIDAAIGSTQGEILYRNGTVWTVLATGTSGQFLQTQGASANPTWQTIGYIQNHLAGLAVTEVSVLSQGADPTGVADSSAAFNAACAVATASGGGQYCKVHIPAGTYRINAQVNVENCSVVGDGRVNTFITVDQNFSSSATAVFNLTSNSLDAGPELRDFSIQFAQPSTQGTRANFLTLAAGGTSGSGGTGIQYPPAINAASNSTRYKLSGLRISRAWTGINSNGVNAVWWLDDIEMSALYIGFYANGTQDFSHIKGFHFWNFDIPTATALFTGVWEDGNTVAANIGRMDGINVSDFTVFQARVQLTSSFTFGQFENVMMDGNGSTFEIAGNNWLQINNIYFTGDATGANTNSQLTHTGGTFTNITNFFSAMSTIPAINMSGGSLQITSGEINVNQPNGSAMVQSAGYSVISGMQFAMNTANGTWTVPIVSVTGGGIRFFGNALHAPSTGTAGGLVTVDVLGNSVFGNNFNGWGWTPPGNTGFYGANDVFTPMPTFFGTGADGNATISSGTTTLGRDTCYNNLTINGTGVLNVAGFRLFVAGKLDLSAAQAGAIISNGNGSPTGNAGSGATGGAAPNALTAVSLPSARGGPVAAGLGGTGTATAGGAGGQTSNITVSNGGAGGLGGNGGASSTPNAGGSAGPQETFLTNPGGNQINFPYPVTNFTIIYSNVIAPEIIWPGFMGSGGGAGGGDNTHSGGGGGAAAQASDGIAIYAGMINRGTNTTAGIISSVGGVGGAGAAGTGGTAGGGGGGGGAGGGFVYIVAGQLLGSTITNAIDVSGNTGGTGGNSPASGVGGTGGHGGACGGAQIIVLNPPSFTASSGFNAAGSAAVTASTTAGTTGGAGASKKMNL